MTSKLSPNFFFTSPVEVIKVTPKNLEAVAEWCGGKVATVESRRVPGRIDPYIWVPTPKGSSVSWAFPGMYITKRLAVSEQGELKETYSIFRKDYFTKNYFDNPTEAFDATWGRAQAERAKARREARTITIVVPEGQDLTEVRAKLTELTEASVPPRTEAVEPTVFSDYDVVGVAQQAAFPSSIVNEREEAREILVEAEHAAEVLATPAALPAPDINDAPSLKGIRGVSEQAKAIDASMATAEAYLAGRSNENLKP